MNGISALFAYVQRRPARGANNAARSASARNVRVTEQFSRQQAPDPIRYGDTPARISKQQIATFLAIAPYFAVMRDDFWVSIVAPQKRAHTLQGPGSQNPWGERANIHREQAVAFGSLVTLNPTDPYATDPTLKAIVPR